ncbi:MAG: polyphenol oxidase family protein [Candidatus Sabulitectum sp.]|nr:polyphenol oxidase family protein [Candidatus Sabulitectum sp.]
MVIIPGTDMYIGLCGSDGKPDPVPENAVFLDQIHSNRIVIDPGGGESADGMIMGRRHGIPALRVADCLPVFALWDDCIGAAHAGWRGLASGIVENLITAVDQPLRWLITGPCICGECYVVGDEVREAVLSGDPAGESGHPSGRLDLRKSAFRRARRVCSEEFRLIDIDECTFESFSLHSFRRDGTEERNFIWLAEIERDEHIRQLNSEIKCNSPERRKN